MSGSGREARRFASRRPRLGSPKLPHSRSFLSRVENQPRKRVNPRNVRSRRRSAESELRRCVIDGSGQRQGANESVEDHRGPSRTVEVRRGASKSIGECRDAGLLRLEAPCRRSAASRTLSFSNAGRFVILLLALPRSRFVRVEVRRRGWRGFLFLFQ